MALSQLLQPRSSLFIRRNGFRMSVRCFSSPSSDAESEKSSQFRKAGTAKERRAEAVESFVKKYMERNPGVFPNATHIQNKVGGSWYTVKETLQRIKEKMLGAPQPEIVHRLNDSVPALAPTACNSNLSDQPNLGAQTDLAVIPQTMDENIRHTAINASAESSSDLVVDATASDVTKIHDSLGSCELHVASVLPAKSERKVSGSEKDASANVIPPVSRSQPEGTMELNAVSNSLQLELENGHMLRNKVHSHMAENSGRDLVLNSAKFSGLEHSKVIYTSYRDQQENEELTRRLLLNISSDMTDKNAFRRSSGKISNLADLFRESMDGEAAVAESKYGQLPNWLQSGTFQLAIEKHSRANQLSSSDPFSSSESPSNMQITGLNKSVFTEYENHPPEEEMTISSEAGSVVSKVTEPFAATKKTESLENTNTTNNQASKVKNYIKGDSFLQRYMGHLEVHKEKDGVKSFDLKHLIECIKKLPRPSNTKSQENTPTCKNNGSSNISLSEGAESEASLQGFRKKGRLVSEGTTVYGKLEDDGSVNILPANLSIDNDPTNHPEFSASDLVRSLPTNKKELNVIEDKFLLSKDSDQNIAMVKFLRTIRESDIYCAFQDCGDISKVEISYVKGAFYKVAYVYFRTREGLRKALEKTDLCIGPSHPTVEAAHLIEDIPNRISIPSLIGNPNVPAALVKNPTRTVMVRELTRDISCRHIEAALTFCGSNVTGFYLGSSNSVAYVEFETEEGKETALAKRSIAVLGKQLLISRIDIPRTTVVRISYHPAIKIRDVLKACNSVGEVRAVKPRQKGLLDVHYMVAEWPNMLNILNRLNEIQVDGLPLLAQPATVIPPEILRALWYQPEERKNLITMAQKLLHRVGRNIPIRADFIDLVESFYKDKL